MSDNTHIKTVVFPRSGWITGFGVSIPHSVYYPASRQLSDSYRLNSKWPWPRGEWVQDTFAATLAPAFDPTTANGATRQLASAERMPPGTRFFTTEYRDIAWSANVADGIIQTYAPSWQQQLESRDRKSVV